MDFEAKNIKAKSAKPSVNIECGQGIRNAEVGEHGLHRRFLGCARNDGAAALGMTWDVAVSATAKQAGAILIDN